VGFYANRRRALLLTLNQSRASSTERVEHQAAIRYFKTVKVLADEMWREGKYKAVPFVSRAVMRHQFV
jgi:hypothetical protein